MRKSSLFKNEDLEESERNKPDYNRKIMIMSQGLSLADGDEEKTRKLIEKKINQKPKKKRYSPLKDNTRAIAKIVLNTKIEGTDLNGDPIRIFDIRESNGAKWIDAKFILEGKYNNRWVMHRFMIVGRSSPTKKLVAQTREIIKEIFSCYGIEKDAPLRKINELRVPVIIGEGPRHGDNIISNYIKIVLSPNPNNKNYSEYERFAKSRSVKLLYDEQLKNKKRWIDIPGWNLYPFTDLFLTLKNKINNFDTDSQKRINRAINKMENNR